MKSIIINEGFELNTLFVPPFILNRGEYLSLNFPNYYDPKEEKQMIEILIGKKQLSAVKVSELILPISFDVKQTLFNRFFTSQNAFFVLKKNSKLSDSGVDAILQGLKIRRNEDVLKLEFNRRKLLALEAAYSKTKNIIINCSGLDYTGMTKMQERMLPQLKEGSVIELNYLSSKGREYVLDVERKEVDITQK